MKKTVLFIGAFLCCMVFAAGCGSWARYSDICERFPPKEFSGDMSLDAASKIVKETLASIPAGHHPIYPGDHVLGKYATSVRLRRHNRTDLVLVEVHEKSRVMMEFYVRTPDEGEKFAAAVWRLRQEYRDK